MRIVSLYYQWVEKISPFKDIPLLALRFVLAYSFWTTGMAKWSDIQSVAEWLGHYPRQQRRHFAERGRPAASPTFLRQLPKHPF
jgi:uncharacterized membrane protein YphA (DoxX/SURF4 family)